MTSLFFGMIYTGGIFSMPDRKIGVWERITWPVTLGEYLHKLAIEADK